MNIKIGKGVKVHKGYLHHGTKLSGEKVEYYKAICGADGAGGGYTLKGRNLGAKETDLPITCEKCLRMTSENAIVEELKR
jgi:hypothetical protein